MLGRATQITEVTAPTSLSLVVKVCLMLVSTVIAPVALGDINVGSDGSDGALDLTGTNGTITIDLSLAAELCDCDNDAMVDDVCTWGCPSPVAGQGVYDAEQWAVVFKYSSITIPDGVTVKFANHPSRAPVIWLSQANTALAGTIDIGGENGLGAGGAPSIAEPGPGGFRGGREVSSPGVSLGSGGFGPGGGRSEKTDNGHTAPGGSYGTKGENGNCGLPTTICSSGDTYGNSAILPLIGGSGGSASPRSSSGGGGAGGGAILIAAGQTLTVQSTGQIDADGGLGGSSGSGIRAGSGSGGGVRLIGDSVDLQAGAGVFARGGDGITVSGEGGGDGRIRVEGNSINLSAEIAPTPSTDLPTFLFPPTGTPSVRATLIDTETVPLDPRADMANVQAADVTLQTCDTTGIQIVAENVPVGTVVDVLIVPRSGPSKTISSTPLAINSSGLTATAAVQFDIGFSAVQLRADFAPGGMRSEGATPLPAIRKLRTLNGERVERAVALDGRTYFVTETGRRVPVDSR